MIDAPLAQTSLLSAEQIRKEELHRLAVLAKQQDAANKQKLADAKLGGALGSIAQKTTQQDAVNGAKLKELGVTPAKAPLGSMPLTGWGNKPQEAAQVPPTTSVQAPIGKGTLTDADRERYESNGDPLAKNPKSSAFGKHQMTDDAWTDVIAANPQMANVNRKDGAVQDLARDQYKAVLTKQLQARGIDPNPDNINRAWVVGAGGLNSVSKLDPNAPLSDALSARAISDNPNLSGGKTAGEFLTNPNPYSRGNGSGIPAVPKPAVSPFDAAVKAQSRDLMTHKNANTDLSGAVDRLNDANGVVPGLPLTMQPEAGVPRPDNGYGVSRQDYEDMATPQVAPVEAEPVFDKTKFDALGTYTFTKQDEIEKLKTAALAQPGTDKDKQSWFAKALEGLFGESGLFNKRELIRFSLAAAIPIMTGSTVGGSIRWAGKDALQQSDIRLANWNLDNRAKQKAASDLSEKDAVDRKAQLKKNETDTDAYDKEVRATALKQAESLHADGKLSTEKLNEVRSLVTGSQVNRDHLKEAFGIMGDPRAATPAYLAGLGKEPKPVDMQVLGSTKPVKVYSKGDGSLVQRITDSNGRESFHPVDPTKVFSTEAIDKEVNTAVAGLDRSGFQSQKGSDGKPRPAVFPEGMEAGFKGDIRAWMHKQISLGQPHTLERITPALNAYLEQAARTPGTKPNMSKALDLMTISTSSLTDPTKSNRQGTDTPVSPVETAPIVSVVKTIFKDATEKKPVAGFSNAQSFMDDVARSFAENQGQTKARFDREAILQGVPRGKIYNSISEAPNDWWAFVQRRIYQIEKGK